MSEYSNDEKRLDERLAARAKKIERAKSSRKRNGILLVVSLMLILGMAAAGTTAWLVSGTDPVNNAFTPSKVTCAVKEQFDGATLKKENVAVTNTGDTEAYIRVRLVTYRRNGGGEPIGGTVAALPDFTNTNWIKIGDYYYHKAPVAVGTDTGVLISSYTLATYDDNESQVLEVLAEAIQSTPMSAVTEAWGVAITGVNITG